VGDQDLAQDLTDLEEDQAARGIVFGLLVEMGAEVAVSRRDQ
jgi:hypothetical protein